MVGANFEIGGRQVDKYIREKDLGVITPDDIVEALIFNGGMKATAVDFMKVNKQSKRVQQWFAARDAKPPHKEFDSIGTCCDMKFSEKDDGSVDLITEKYSGSKNVHYRMTEFKIMEIGRKSAKVPRKAGKQKSTGEIGKLSNEEGRKGEEDIDYDCNIADNEYISVIADSMVGGAKHRRHPDHEEPQFSMRLPIGIAPYTGAAVKFMSKINYWDRSVFLDCK